MSRKSWEQDPYQTPKTLLPRMRLPLYLALEFTKSVHTGGRPKQDTRWPEAARLQKGTCRSISGC